MNLFQFSMPYLAEKVVDMLHNVLKKGAEEEGDEDYHPLHKEGSEIRSQMLS